MGVRVCFEPHLESINNAFIRYFSDHEEEEIDFVLLDKPMRKKGGPFFVLQAIWYRIRSVVAFVRDYDIVHVNSAKFGIAAYVASFFGCKYIYTIHFASTEEKKGSLMSWIYYILEVGLLRLVAGRAACVTTVSEYCRQEISRRFKVNPLVVHNGYDEIQFNITNRGPVKVKEELMLGKELVYISVGRMIDYKKPLNVIRFFAEIKKRSANSKLIFIGDGDLYEVVKNEIASLKLTESVILIKQVDFKDIPEYYRAADYFISACETEAFGLVCLEALACGAAPLVPWKGAFPEIFLDRIFSYDIDKITDIPDRHQLLSHREGILSRFRWADKIALYHRLYVEKAK
ncbi:glycosyltransferase family 4 protein [Chitinophaga sp. CF418]|uniref:glycosyltransferase family 4 protein n=1 Tax=Chitinophaga sp. CF418 TaxID=1855287 RepID=UPI000923CDB4|nr:glycosyltransferase family 4 protein [Chitinophaga sp. CF418]SHN44871.1 Glycosyltransferase involved in cell wall bisynthesis [Chitinophaga sp. CF418]